MALDCGGSDLKNRVDLCAADNVDTRSFRVMVTAAWLNALQPVNADGSSVFKLAARCRWSCSSLKPARGISNLEPKTLSAGTYQLRIALGDAVLRTMNTSLR
jgi:hypothetical protein